MADDRDPSTIGHRRAMVRCAPAGHILRISGPAFLDALDMGS